MIKPLFISYEPLERVTIFTPLGIRLWDPARNVQVTDDLTVKARPQAGGHEPVTAFRTASGIYAFRGLPGLHDIEYPPEDALLASPPVASRFIIEVIDHQRRFLPVVFSLDIPYQDIFPNGSSPLGNGLPGFYLFSAPTRRFLLHWRWCGRN